MRFLSGTFCALWLGFCGSAWADGNVNVSFTGLTLNIVGSNDFDAIAVARSGSVLFIEGKINTKGEPTHVLAGSGATQVSDNVVSVPLWRVWNLSISMLAGHDYVGVGAATTTFGNEYWTLLGNLTIDMGAGFGVANDGLQTDGGDQVQIYFLTTLLGQSNISLTGLNDPDSFSCGNLFDMADCACIAPFTLTLSDNLSFNGNEQALLFNTWFLQRVTVTCGNGDDQVNLGSGGTIFLGPVTIDGGSDVSGLGGTGDIIGGNPLFLSLPSITGFEINELPGN